MVVTIHSYGTMRPNGRIWRVVMRPTCLGTWSDVARSWLGSP